MCKKSIWCGDGDKPENYIREGTRNECLKKGFGVGFHKHKRDGKEKNDLYQIPYMNEKIRTNLYLSNITTVEDFLYTIRNSYNFEYTKIFLLRVGFSGESYNSVLFFLYNNRIPITKLPACL